MKTVSVAGQARIQLTDNNKKKKENLLCLDSV